MQADNLTLDNENTDDEELVYSHAFFSSSVPALLPRVLIIALDPTTQDMPAYFFKGRAKVTISTTVADAFSQLMNESFKAVLIVDPVITQKSLPALRSRITSYAKSGGRVIFCYGFAILIRPSQFEYYMRMEFNLPWKYGNYYHTEFFLNPAGTNLCHEPHFFPWYAMKAIGLKNVDPASKIYQPTANSTLRTTTNRGIDSSPTVDTSQVPIAFTKIGKGWLGYIGDVNMEAETVKVLLAMIDSKVDRVCYNCGMSPQDPSMLLNCSRCENAVYCTPGCQMMDWGRHGCVCRQLQY